MWPCQDAMFIGCMKRAVREDDGGGNKQRIEIDRSSKAASTRRAGWEAIAEAGSTRRRGHIFVVMPRAAHAMLHSSDGWLSMAKARS